MIDAVAVDLSTCPTDELEAGAATFDAIAASWRDLDGAAGLVDLYDNFARAFREEAACRSAGVDGGVRTVIASLGAVTDAALATAIKLINREAEGLDREEITYEILLAMGAPIYKEMMLRRAMAAVTERTDTIPSASMN